MGFQKLNLLNLHIERLNRTPVVLFYEKLRPEISQNLILDKTFINVQLYMLIFFINFDQAKSKAPGHSAS